MISLALLPVMPTHSGSKRAMAIKTIMIKAKKPIRIQVISILHQYAAPAGRSRVTIAVDNLTRLG